MMIKIVCKSLLVVVALIAVGYGGLVGYNNRPVEAPMQQDISASWEKSVAWLMNNREEILRDNNPALWWMIGQSAELTGDSRLQALFDENLRDFKANHSRSVWQAFYSPSAFWGYSFPKRAYESVPDYQQYFLFSLTCGKELAENPLIAAQHEMNFCRTSHPVSPACVTHQLMGFRLQQRIGCDRVPGLAERIAASQNIIASQLTWDPRVVDVYIQRVLMLVDSGAPERIKPIWLRRVLDAQLPDGSWSNLQPLIPLGGGRYFGFDARLVGVGPLRANFHASAQGVWLTSLLRSGAVATTAAEPVQAAE